MATVRALPTNGGENMKSIRIAGLMILSTVPIHLHAQDSLVGKYSGTYTVPTQTGDR